ncbi:MAG: TlpA family protein disulfide reductase [Sphingorhabdus sp.]|uniref:TlpA family protein disulfide reductase n=1 Tax=Sphingorhabdus sp. TaxID=1902408 RepID=UPI0025E53ED2|nr:TlpA disulfide reductase family protein [Sphingorhabdus sp.]MCO4091377.1 TlpA family protein disulfide reductase [Sphingorhabdus sp.]
MRFVIALILLVLTGCDKETPGQGQAQPALAANLDAAGKTEIMLESANGTRATLSYKFAGQKAPTAPFADADGQDVTLADFEGKPLLLNIWATWCAPCKAEMPTLDALAKLEKNRMAVIAVSQDLEGRTPVLAFFKETKVQNLVPYTDADNAILAAFNNAIALPTTILYDSAGKEVWRIAGGVEWDDAEMAKLLRTAD